jgi:hypothetical protein
MGPTVSAEGGVSGYPGFVVLDVGRRPSRVTARASYSLNGLPAVGFLPPFRHFRRTGHGSTRTSGTTRAAFGGRSSRFESRAVRGECGLHGTAHSRQRRGSQLQTAHRTAASFCLASCQRAEPSYPESELSLLFDS